MEPLEGIARADEHLGHRVPLPTAALPLGRWTEVYSDGPGAVEVVWNLDDTRPTTPGRLALRVSHEAPPTRLGDAEVRVCDVGQRGARRREAALEEAQPSLRPVIELCWESGGVHLRLTAQGPWDDEVLLALARSVG
jgi:hypothetical protein